MGANASGDDRVASRLVSDVSPQENLPIEGPLAANHKKLGAKMATFGGWSMPLSYAGVVEEHGELVPGEAAGGVTGSERRGEALDVARRLTAEIQRPLSIDGRSLAVSASVGVAAGGHYARSADQCRIARAPWRCVLHRLAGVRFRDRTRAMVACHPRDWRLRGPCPAALEVDDRKARDEPSAAGPVGVRPFWRGCVDFVGGRPPTFHRPNRLLGAAHCDGLSRGSSDRCGTACDLACRRAARARPPH